MKDKWLVLDVPEPKNLLEIVEGGIRDMYMATSAIGELMKQLSACQEAKTMILLDQYSHWFKPSAFQSFRYLDVPRARRGRIRHVRGGRLRRENFSGWLICKIFPLV